MPVSFIKKQLRTETVQHVMVLFSGLAISQAIPILSMIILTRIYPEDAFGIFFIYSSSTVILTIIATLKFELAVVLPEDEESAFHLLILSLLLSLVMSILILLFIIIFYEWITSLLTEKRIGAWLYALPLSIFLSGVFESTNFWFNRKKQFKKISVARIARTIGLSTTQITLGLLNFLHIGLIAGLIVGQCIAAIVNLTKIIRSEKHSHRLPTWENGKQLIRKFRNIPLFNTSIGLINTLSNQLPVFLLSNFYGVSITGYYGLANRIVQTPMGLIGRSVGQVFFQKASARFNEEGNIFRIVRKTYWQLFKVGIVPFLLLFIFAPFIFRLVFGEPWETAGHYAKILIPWLFIAFLNAPVSYLVTILNKQHKLTVYELILLISRFIGLYAGYKIWSDVIYTIVLFSAIGLVSNIFLFFYYMYMSKSTYKNITG